MAAGEATRLAAPDVLRQCGMGCHPMVARRRPAAPQAAGHSLVACRGAAAQTECSANLPVCPATEDEEAEDEEEAAAQEPVQAP